MSNKLKLLCWNVHYPKFAYDSAYVVETIESLGDFDIICLQEYVKGTDDQILDWFEDNGYHTDYLPFSGTGNLSQGVMTAVRKSMAPNTQKIILRSDEPRRFRPFPNTRGLLATSIKINGKNFSIYNIHLTLPRPYTIDMRAREFKKLEEFLEQSPHNQPWFMCGDFNFFGLDWKRNRLTGKYNHFSGNLINKTWRHHLRYTPIRANLDYFFWKGNIKVAPQLAHFNTSDHRPLTAEISIN